jgi:hypothetical protein
VCRAQATIAGATRRDTDSRADRGTGSQDAIPRRNRGWTRLSRILTLGGSTGVNDADTLIGSGAP